MRRDRTVNAFHLGEALTDSVSAPEMAGYHQGSEVLTEAAPPQHGGVSRLLPERAHSLGEFARGHVHPPDRHKDTTPITFWH